MYCTNCGNKLEEQELYCTRCGKMVVKNTVEVKSKKRSDLCIILGILSMLLFFLPFISIPLGIVGIIKAKDSGKSDNRILGIIGLVMSIVFTLFVVLSLFLAFRSIEIYHNNYNNDYYNDYDNKDEIDITDYKWQSDRDSSVLSFDGNKIFEWNGNSVSKVSSGTYEMYEGEEAIKYLENYASLYGSSKENYSEKFGSSFYGRESCYLLILKFDNSDVEGDNHMYLCYYDSDADRLRLFDLEKENYIYFSRYGGDEKENKGNSV